MRLFLRMVTRIATMMPLKSSMVKNLCSVAACLMSKKTFEKVEMVNFGLIFGGLAMTCGMVSRIEVLDGIM